MSDFSARLQSLSPEKQKLLELYLKNKGIKDINGFSSIQPVVDNGHYPTGYYAASSAQKRLFLIDQIEGAAHLTYNLPSVMVIEGELDVGRFEQSFRELINRHESLRTSFELVDGELAQKIHQDIAFAISYFELEEDEANEARLYEMIANLIQPFDLGKPPLLRVSLIKLSPYKHILVYDMHHIISDGASMEIVIREQASLYRGELLPELRIQYKDFAAWQNNFLNSPAIKKQEEYWLATFAGEVPVLNMPADYTRPSIQSFAGDRIFFEAGNTVAEDLKSMTAGNETTVFMILLAAFNVLLSKYSGQEDIVVGSPIAGRRHADLENIIGMFVNTLAMRNYPKSNKTFMEFLDEVKEQCLRSYENQDYQFEQLVEKLDVRRDISRNPLFDIAFVLQNTNSRAHSEDLGIKGLRFKPYEFNYAITKFDITLNTFELDTTAESSQATHEARIIYFSLEYNTKLFKKETIERLRDHFINILNTITKHPEIRISAIDILTPSEKRQIIHGFNNTTVEYPKHKTVHELFEAQAERTPGNIAAVFKDNVLTYRELNEKANQLARLLRAKGIRPDEIAGLLLEPSLAMFIGIMGVLKAGGAYLLIDPEYPEERIKYMLADSDARFLLSEYSLSRHSSFKGEIIDLWNEELYGRESLNLKIINQPKDLAYVIYTSGSTGKPKGVLIEHHSLVNLCMWHIQSFELTERDRIMKYAGLGFDASVWEIFPCLFAGAAIYVVEKEIKFDTEKLNEFMIQKNITVSFLPTQLCEQFMDQNNTSLRILLTGGDKLKYYTGNHYKLINNYGPTENTVVTTSCHIDGECYTSMRDIPIGDPINNTRVYIIDKHNNLQPVGIAGELCISGAGLARGYLNNPELTGEKFIPNPYEPGEIMYQTGDLARWASDGKIKFMGRIDSQVKIRGYRIEIGEIEAALLKNQAVKEAVVIDNEDRDGNKYLCAYIVMENASDYTAQDLEISKLRAHLSKILPDYMIPTCFVRIENVPLTSNGKIDRKALPEYSGNMNTGMEYIAPSNETEKKLAEIWQEILGVKQIGVTNNFFEIGGHSLKAVQVVEQAKKYNINISVSDIFSYQTIRRILENIEYDKKVELREETADFSSSDDNSEGDKNIVVPSDFRFGGHEYKELTIKLVRTITSFLARGFTLCIIPLDEKAYPWFYQHYIQICSQIDDMGYTIVDFVEPRFPEELIEAKFTGYDSFIDVSNIINYVIAKIDLGYFLVMCLDEYYLKEKESFRKAHFVHETMIYGYDNAGGKFLAIGFNADRIFDKFTFDYDMFAMAFEEGKLYYKEHAPYAVESAVGLLKRQGAVMDFVFDIGIFLNDLHQYLLSTGDISKVFLIQTMPGSECGVNIKYGLDVHDVVIEKLSNLLKDNLQIDYRTFHMLYEHKKIMYDRLQYITVHYDVPDGMAELSRRYTGVVEQFEDIRLKSFQISYSKYTLKKRNKAVIEQIINSMITATEDEKNILSGIYESLKQKYGSPLDVTLA